MTAVINWVAASPARVGLAIAICVLAVLAIGRGA